MGAAGTPKAPGRPREGRMGWGLGTGRRRGGLATPFSQRAGEGESKIPLGRGGERGGGGPGGGGGKRGGGRVGIGALGARGKGRLGSGGGEGHLRWGPRKRGPGASAPCA